MKMCECVACHEYDAKNLIAENRRYEEALQKIVDMLGPTVASYDVFIIARAALDGEDK